MRRLRRDVDLGNMRWAGSGAVEDGAAGGGGMEVRGMWWAETRCEGRGRVVEEVEDLVAVDGGENCRRGVVRRRRAVQPPAQRLAGQGGSPSWVSLMFAVVGIVGRFAAPRAAAAIRAITAIIIPAQCRPVPQTNHTHCH